VSTHISAETRGMAGKDGKDRESGALNWNRVRHFPPSGCNQARLCCLLWECSWGSAVRLRPRWTADPGEENPTQMRRRLLGLDIIEIGNRIQAFDPGFRKPGMLTWR